MTTAILRLQTDLPFYPRPKTSVAKTNPYRAGHTDGYQLREPLNLWAEDRPMFYKFPNYFKTKSQIYIDAYAEGRSRRLADELKKLPGGQCVSV